MNRFQQAYYNSPEPLLELLEFFDSNDITFYGVNLRSESLRKLRHNIMMMNKTVEEMQK